MLIAGIIEDKIYFREQVEPLSGAGGATSQSANPIYRAGGRTRQERLVCPGARIAAFEHHPERFGLVLAEANAAGVPVIAMNLGSCGEVIEDRRTGFLVNTANDAVQALQRLAEIDSTACRERVQQRFSINAMVDVYERVYERIFDFETKKRS